MCKLSRLGPPTRNSTSSRYQCVRIFNFPFLLSLCFDFKVTVDGKAYQPSVACDNKKKAKADAATYALQQLGFMAVDPNNPL